MCPLLGQRRAYSRSFFHSSLGSEEQGDSAPGLSTPFGRRPPSGFFSAGGCSGWSKTAHDSLVGVSFEALEPWFLSASGDVSPSSLSEPDERFCSESVLFLALLEVSSAKATSIGDLADGDGLPVPLPVDKVFDCGIGEVLMSLRVALVRLSTDAVCAGKLLISATGDLLGSGRIGEVEVLCSCGDFTAKLPPVGWARLGDNCPVL